MKRHDVFGFALLCVLLPVGASAAGISALTDTPQQFNGKAVTVRGLVVDFHENPSQIGSAYAMFSVCGGGCVRVYAPGNPRLTNGQSVTVSGTFATVDHVNGNVYYNQIDSDALSIHADNPTAAH